MPAAAKLRERADGRLGRRGEEMAASLIQRSEVRCGDYQRSLQRTGGEKDILLDDDEGMFL